MINEQRIWKPNVGWVITKAGNPDSTPQLVLAFGAYSILKNASSFEGIKDLYPNSHIICCSTAGEILGNQVSDNTIVLNAVYFEKTEIKFSETDVSGSSDSYEAGKRISSQLDKNRLVHILVFSDGLNVNGTSLVRGMTEDLPTHISVTGGLVGDGGAFKETLTGLDKPPASNKIVAIGLYSDHLAIGYGSLGGWDTFGPNRLITKSKENVLYEIDGKPALQLYKEYLGELAKELPGSGLLFPMSLTLPAENGSQVEVVRTLLGVNEADQSLTFAGDMPEHTYAKLMKANFDRLIDGAAGAANMSIESLKSQKADLAILISCIGRKLVLKERVEEETEAVQLTIGLQASLIGFYSYGEICPTSPTEKHCQLHNQTMTITTFHEF